MAGILLVVASTSVACHAPADLPRTAARAAVVAAVTDTHVPRIAHARYLRLAPHPQGTLVELRAPVDDSLRAREQRLDRVLVLVRRHRPPGARRATRRGDTLVIDAPAMRWAVNANNMEAYLDAIGLGARLVAVGGTNSWNDSTRARALRGALGQVGYGWHSPPNLEVLVATDPDVFVMGLKRLAHAAQWRRAVDLGITAMPSFAEEEPTHLGRAEWLKLYGVLAGVPSRADSVFAAIERRVDSLRAIARTLPRLRTVWAYYEGRDRWRVTARGPLAELVRDAGGDDVYAGADAAGEDFEFRVSTEAFLVRARDADCWIAGDGWPEAEIPPDVGVRVRAYRGRCVLLYNGRVKPAADAWDWYQSAFVQPDRLLAEFIRALHPGAVDASWDYLRPYARFATR